MALFLSGFALGLFLGVTGVDIAPQPRNPHRFKNCL
jgi:hypothetical protein